MDRDEIRNRFERWLDEALADEAPPAGIPEELLSGAAAPSADPTDWSALWSATTALTQEVKLQGRAFKQLHETLSAAPAPSERLESLDTLLELRERLLRGLEAAGNPPAVPPDWLDRIFPARRREVERALDTVRALQEGYRMSLAWLDDALAGMHVEPIACEGRPFDPRRMNAVDAEETAAAADGAVLRVYRTGYLRNGELYRPAQVCVARRPADGSAQ